MQQHESAPEVTASDSSDESPRHSYDLKAGDHDAELNKTVHDAVMVSDTFVVYLADDLSIQWKTSAEHPWAQGSGEVLNRVAILEARARFIHERDQLEPSQQSNRCRRQRW